MLDIIYFKDFKYHYSSFSQVFHLIQTFFIILSFIFKIAYEDNNKV